MPMKANVIMPAGGTGERMRSSTPKQYCLLQGRPLISYTIEIFEKLSWVESIFVCVARSWLDEVQGMIAKYNHKKVRLVEAAETRHLSIHNGVKAIDKDGDGDKLVIIHDSVRLFVSESIIEDVANAAFIHGAAGVTRPLISTVIAVDNDEFLDHSLDRTKYVASEMPQAFRFDVIKTAYDKATEFDFRYGTECLHLALTYSGCKAKLVRTNEDLWKVTHKRDLYAADAILKERKQFVEVINHSEDFAVLENELKKTFQDQIQCVNSECAEIATFRVFIMNSFNHEELKKIVRKYEQKSQKNGLTECNMTRQRCCLFLFPTEEEESFLKIRTVLKEFTDQLVCLAVIISKDFARVVSMVHSLISDGNTCNTLNGQVLFAE